MSTSDKNTTIVLVDGCRIPFQKPGTSYRSYRAHDLARFAIRGLLDRTGLDPALVDRVVLGNVIQDRETSNVAREAALGAGLPATVTAQTVTMSCLSGNLAITSAAEAILSGQADVVIAGGTDSASAYLERFPLKKHRALPYLNEFSTGESMGEYADRLASLYAVARETQDAYTVRSHQSAVMAFREGMYDGEVVPVTGPPDFVPVTQENMIRPETTQEALSLLKPSFNHKFGTVTAANASNYADGAAAMLLMSEAKAAELGLKPLARLVSWVYTAGSPKDEMLLGQVSAIPALLAGMDPSEKGAAKTGTGSVSGTGTAAGGAAGGKAGGSIHPDDIDVFELQETFAAQILAVLDAIAVGGQTHAGSDATAAADEVDAEESASKSTGKTAGKPSGQTSGETAAVSIPLKKLNTLGGTLALGHVFGATGVRLVTTAAKRLVREEGRYALVAGCSGGGLGHAMLLESMEGPVPDAAKAQKAAKRTTKATASDGTKSQKGTKQTKKAPAKPKTKPKAK